MQKYGIAESYSLRIFAKMLQIFATLQFMYREIVYDGNSSIRTAFNSLGTRMDDFTQHGYESYHSHEDYQLMYLQEGNATITVDDVPHVYVPGDTLLLGSNLPHKIEAFGETPCNGVLIQFKKSLFPKEMYDVSDYCFIASLLRKSWGGLIFHTCDREETSAEPKQGHQSLNDRFLAIHQASGIDRLCLLLHLLDKLGRELDRGTAISHLSELPERESLGAVVKRCKQFLKTHYRNDISLPDLSAMLGANETALCRKFKEETGETICQYLTHLRIEAACKMLRNTKYSVSESAFRCGFNTRTHFNRKFKEITGMSPKEFRGEK